MEQALPESKNSKRLSDLRAARTVFVQTLGLNLLVSISKLVCGFSTNTLSMIADGFHSFLDASSNIVGIVGLTISIRPPDAGHPYGHRKFEAIAAMTISFIMFFASFNVVSQVFERVFYGRGEHPSVNAASYLIMVFGVAVNIAVTAYERRKARSLNSQLLKADSEHTLSDIYVSLGVIVAIFAAQFQLYSIDLIVSVFIVLAIFRAGFGIIMAHLGTLVDAAILDPSLVEKIVLDVPGVISCHKIRSRGMHDQIFMDLHVQVSGKLSVEEAHKIAYAVESALQAAHEGIMDIVVHIEEQQSESSKTASKLTI